MANFELVEITREKYALNLILVPDPNEPARQALEKWANFLRDSLETTEEALRDENWLKDVAFKDAWVKDKER